MKHIIHASCEADIRCVHRPVKKWLTALSQNLILNAELLSEVFLVQTHLTVAVSDWAHKHQFI